MAYNKTIWSDRIVDKPLTYTFQTNADGTTTLIPAEGTIVQSGTPITAAELNNMEDGIGNNDSRLTANEASLGTIENQAVYSGAKNTLFKGINFGLATLLFFTNGGSDQATANYTFGNAYASAPEIMPANITATVPYSDVLMYPFIYNVTATGFSVRLQTVGGGLLGTVGSPANIFMNFMVFGTF